MLKRRSLYERSQAFREKVLGPDVARVIEHFLRSILYKQ